MFTDAEWDQIGHLAQITATDGRGAELLMGKMARALVATRGAITPDDAPDGLLRDIIAATRRGYQIGFRYNDPELDLQIGKGGAFGEFRLACIPAEGTSHAAAGFAQTSHIIRQRIRDITGGH